MNNKILFTALLLTAIIFSLPVKAQVTIGSTVKPNPNSLLDLKENSDNFSTKGLVLPRVKLIETTDPAPLQAHVKGMFVYNTEDYGSGVTAVIEGVYYNDGSKWIAVTSLAPVTRNNTTNTVTATHGGNFTVIDGITTDAHGRITAVNTITVTLPVEVDAIVGNEVTNTTDVTLVRSGSGNTASPYTLARAALTGDVTVAAGSNATSIANNAVTSAKILDGTIVAADIANNTITAGKIAGGTSGQVLTSNGTSAASWQAANHWHITGNAGTAPATNFLGTTDAQPLVIRVANTRAGYISNLTSAYNYNAIGLNALAKNTGVDNNAFGLEALGANTTGGNNSAFGIYALRYNTTGERNSAFGAGALYSNTIGGHNSAFGNDALFYLNGTTATEGTGNSALGYNAGSSLTTGSYNVIIGYNVQPLAVNSDNTITIGTNYTAVSTQANTRVFAPGWTYSSDRKWKHDIKPAKQGLNFVMKLKPSEFIFNGDESNTKVLGFIAQDVQETMREEGMATGYGMVSQMTEDRLGLATTELIPVLTKAIQEQQAVIEALLRRVEELEQRVKN